EPLERPVRIAYDLAVGEQHRRRGDASGAPMLGFSRDRDERTARMSRALVREGPPQPLRERGAVELDHLEGRHAGDPGGYVVLGQRYQIGERAAHRRECGVTTQS